MSEVARNIAAFGIGLGVIAAFVAVLFGLFSIAGPEPVLLLMLIGGFAVLAYAIGRGVLDALKPKVTR